MPPNSDKNYSSAAKRKAVKDVGEYLGDLYSQTPGWRSTEAVENAQYDARPATAKAKDAGDYVGRVGAYQSTRRLSDINRAVEAKNSLKDIMKNIPRNTSVVNIHVNSPQPNLNPVSSPFKSKELFNKNAKLDTTQVKDVRSVNTELNDMLNRYKQKNQKKK